VERLGWALQEKDSRAGKQRFGWTLEWTLEKYGEKL